MHFLFITLQIIVVLFVTFSRYSNTQNTESEVVAVDGTTDALESEAGDTTTLPTESSEENIEGSSEAVEPSTAETRTATTKLIASNNTASRATNPHLVPTAATVPTTANRVTVSTATSAGSSSPFPVRALPSPSILRNKQIRLCLVIESSPSLFYNYRRVAAAIDKGVERANKQILIEGYTINPYYKNMGRTCDKKNDAVKNVLDIQNSGITCSAYLGPGCGYNADSLYNYVEYTQTSIMACPGAGSSNAADRSQYPLLARVSFTHKDTTALLFRFFRAYQYSHVFAIMDTTNSFYEQFGITFSSELRKQQDLVQTILTRNIKSATATNQTYTSLLKEGNSTARVFLLAANATVTRQIMITALQMGMTDGSYVYIAIELFQSSTWGPFTWNMGTSSDRDAKLAYTSMLLIALNPQRTDYYAQFASEIREESRIKYNYTFEEFENIDPVVISFYEAVIMYASIVNQVLTMRRNIFDGQLVSSLYRNQTFPSPVTGTVTMDGGGDRQSDFVIKTLDSKSGRFLEFITYMVSTNKFTQTGPPLWPSADGFLPPDTPRCGFTGEALICHPQGLSGGLLAAVVVIPLLIVLALCGIICYFVARSLRNEGLDPNWWRVTMTELDITGTKGSQGSRIASSKKSLNDDTQSQTTRQTDTVSGASVMLGRTATLRGNVITIIDVSEKRRRPNPQMIKELNQVRVITHQNLQRLLGVSVNDDGYIIYILGELCQKGSLTDLLEKDSLKLDWSFKNSLIKDLVMGMTYLQGTAIESHGNLTAHTCLIDSRFMLKITDFGLNSFREIRDLDPPSEDQNDRHFDLLLWRAPELLRQVMPIKGSQVGDVYSFAILLQQIILRTAPFDTPGDPTKAHQTAKEMVMEVKKGTQPPFRPQVPPSACSNELFTLMERCWDEYPIERPTFSKIKEGLKKVIGNSGDNIIDHLLKRMEQYASDLEAQVAEKTEQFIEEKHRSEELLSQLLPKSIAEFLTRGQNVDPESYDNVTIYFSDIVGFTTISAAGTAMDVVSMLNNLYTTFDNILARFDAYKVETIGDAYMLASGLPVRNGNRHAQQVALVALSIRKDLDTFRIPHLPMDKLRLRIGLCSGPCVAGIVGLKMPRYCLFGDTVQIAQKMESSGQPMKIQVTSSTRELLEEIGSFQMQERDETVMFKENELKTYWLLSGSGK
ncbi:atrial natriuretic peptide receptor 1-like [Paramacrobiotus metropolitanus]|uniref:atrial natriuretic peptide receptor 1-like n=1 Tax=Paramacrobiotus metropolitanus TaxID=2943436 RepID=UPI0024464BAD|nr:atrial natriuretic peptide receptor 1-like [Paramacrobiotus metropolitanus]